MVNENTELSVNELVITNWNWECNSKFSFIYKIWFVFAVKLNIQTYQMQILNSKLNVCLNLTKVVKL